MKQRDFWSGFAAGAAAAVGGFLISDRFGRGSQTRIVRLEKSLQIARPTEEVFRAWSDLERLGRSSRLVEEVRTNGNRSHWKLNLRGIPVEWDAEITQVIPNQAIGWKSVKAPKHSGRITFTTLGNDTLVHVQMNYVPPAGFLRRMLTPFVDEVEGYIEQALRDFKAGLEGSAGGGITGRTAAAHFTGTYGPSAA
jgi:uncharacterized membrane protein